MQTSKLQNIIQKDPSLVWYTNNTSNLSDASIFEHVLNYGTWEQVQESIKTLGLANTIQLYQSLVAVSRSNIKPRVKHYFDLYFTDENERNTSKNSN